MNQGTFKFAAFALTVLLTAGCQSNDKKPKTLHGEDFPDERDLTVSRFEEVQAATAARKDATLRAPEFDAGELNSLGRSKLDLMLKDDDACAPLAVYVDAGRNSDLSDRREKSVRTFLKDRGLTESQIKIDSGPNPYNAMPAAPAMMPAAAPAPRAPEAGPMSQ